MPNASVLADRELLSCVIERVDRWKFPKPKAGAAVKVVCPFVRAIE